MNYREISKELSATVATFEFLQLNAYSIMSDDEGEDSTKVKAIKAVAKLEAAIDATNNARIIFEIAADSEEACS